MKSIEFKRMRGGIKPPQKGAGVKQFEVGKAYEPYQTEFDAITVLRRTEKTIWCDNGQAKFCMRIRTDAEGNEYAIDSTVPARWRDAFTYTA